MLVCFILRALCAAPSNILFFDNFDTKIEDKGSPQRFVIFDTNRATPCTYGNTLISCISTRLSIYVKNAY